MSFRMYLLCLVLTATSLSGARAQEASRLRADGNGIPLLQRPVRVALDGIELGDALRSVAQQAGISLAFSGDLPGLDREVTLDLGTAPAAAALLRLVANTGLELRVFPSGQLVLTRAAPRTSGDSVGAGAPRRVTESLAVTPVRLAEVVITPGRFGVERDGVAAPMALSREDLETAPQLGEDVFRMMSRLPGVAASDVSARFAVRGGANEELLVLLDGMELVEPFHVKDFDGALSIVDGEALAGVALTTGGFTADHGNRLTGVFEMQTAAPSQGSPTTEVGLSLSNARFLSRGAFASGKGQWLVSARRGYLDIMLKLIHEDDEIEPRYGDALAKLQYQPGANHVVSVHGLYASDRLRFRDGDFAARAGYENLYGWINWRARFGDRLAARTLVSTGNLSWDRTGRRDGPNPDIRVTDSRGFGFVGAKQEWSWDATERMVGKWGWSVKSMAAEYDYASYHRSSFISQGVRRARTDTTRVDMAPDGREVGAYLAGRVRPFAAWTLETGLRYDRHTHTGDQVWSPRVNVAWSAGDNTTVRAAWGVFFQAQGIHELQVQDGESRFQRAERAEHRIVSVERLLRGTSLRVEAYQRRLGRVRSRWDNLERFIEAFPEVENDRVLLSPTGGDARGLELFAEGTETGRLRWSASYALARIRDEYGQGPAPRELDQRHTVHLGAGYVPSGSWRVSAAWQLHSGWPTTAREYRSVPLANGSRAVIRSYGPVYGARLPAYHRLDARVTRRWSTPLGELSAFLDAYNLYGRDNPHGYDYDVKVRTDGTVDVNRTHVSLLPFLPSLGVSWRF